jgi:hypothetical protein
MGRLCRRTTALDGAHYLELIVTAVTARTHGLAVRREDRGFQPDNPGVPHNWLTYRDSKKRAAFVIIETEYGVDFSL